MDFHQRVIALLVCPPLLIPVDGSKYSSKDLSFDDKGVLTLSLSCGPGLGEYGGFCTDLVTDLLDRQQFPGNIFLNTDVTVGGDLN